MSEPTNQFDPLQTDQTQVPMRPQEQVQVPMRPADQVEQPAMPLPRPAQPQAPTERGAQPANPQSNQDPNVPNISQRPQPKGIFDRVLESMAGGPTRVTDPQTGEVRELPMTKKGLTAHILAGAIAGIIQGAQAPYVPSENPAGTRSGQNMRALGMGAQATQDKLAQIRNAPQAQYDADQLRKYQTMKRNIDLAQGMLTLGNASREAQDKVDSTGQTLLQHVDDYSPALIPEENRGLTHAEVMKKFPQMSQNNFIPIGHRDMLNDDGSPMVDPKTGVPYREPLFAVVPPNAQVTVTPELKEMFGIQDPKISEIPVGTVISLSHFLNWNNSHIAQVGATDALKDSANQIASVTGKPAVDVSKAIQSDPLLRRNAAVIGKYLGHGNSVDEAIAELQKDKTVDQSVVPRLAKVLGLGEVIDGKSVAQMLALKREADKKTVDSQVVQDRVKAEAEAKRQTPEGQADLLHKQLENRALLQQQAQASAMAKGIEIPKDFVGNPKSNEMDSGALASDLASKGVTVPSNFSALYAIAHNAADLATLPTTPRKGVNVMPRDQALSFIRTFINPQYQEGDYSAAKKLSGEMASTRTGTAGGTLLSAGTAANHLNLLDEAGQALHNNDVQALNKLANAFGVAVGKSPAVTFQAIAEQVNSEVAKVVAGGQPNEPELKANRETLNSDQSPEQIRNVIRAYIGLMNGRIGEIDDRSMQYFGRHVRVSPTTSQVFNKYGFTAPGQPSGATGTVKGSDGRTYWTDGKANLGRVE